LLSLFEAEGEERIERHQDVDAQLARRAVERVADPVRGSAHENSQHLFAGSW
jgi:hypothetical protein